MNARLRRLRANEGRLAMAVAVAAIALLAIVALVAPRERLGRCRANGWAR